MTADAPFNNYTVIVTGASSGVGEACARQFIAAGANVVLAARSIGALEGLARQLGSRAKAVACDVSSREECEGLIEQTLMHFGSLDVLVNNAGFNARGAVEELSLEDMERIIDVNLKAPMRLTRLALPYLRDSAHGRVINIASLAGRFPLDHEASYSASKFGLRAFSLALAEELADSNIRVCLVSPGPIETGFILGEIEDVPNLVFSQPMSTADEIATAVLDSARDGKRERAIPAASGVLATAAYLMPGLRKALRPVLEAKGKRSKERYLQKQS